MNKNRRQRLRWIRDRIASQESLVEELANEEEKAHGNMPKNLQRSYKPIQSLVNIDLLADLNDLLRQAQKKIDKIIGE